MPAGKLPGPRTIARRSAASGALPGTENTTAPPESLPSERAVRSTGWQAPATEHRDNSVPNKTRVLHCPALPEERSAVPERRGGRSANHGTVLHQEFAPFRCQPSSLGYAADHR